RLYDAHLRVAAGYRAGHPSPPGAGVHRAGARRDPAPAVRVRPDPGRPPADTGRAGAPDGLAPTARGPERAGRDPQRAGGIAGQARYHEHVTTQDDIVSIEPIIGMEIHVQLRTRTKLFTGAPSTASDEFDEA